MSIKTYVLTSLVTAALFTFILSFLKVFKFIKWSPIGWSTRYNLLTTAPTGVKWMFLAIFSFIIIFILLKLFSFTARINPVFTSILSGLLIWMLIEWFIKIDFSFFKKSSLPFLAIVILFCRGLVETAVFYERTNLSGSRNRLPSHTDMIK